MEIKFKILACILKGCNEDKENTQILTKWYKEYYNHEKNKNIWKFKGGTQWLFEVVWGEYRSI